MPREELKRQIKLYIRDGYVSFNGVLKIANYFGVSFHACLIQLAYKLHVISGDVSSPSLDDRRKQYGPNKRKKEFGLTDTLLYEQLFNTAEDLLHVDDSPKLRQRFKTEFIFHDARMEGIEIDQGLASEIVVDLRLHKQASRFCSERNQNIIEVAGLTLAYDLVFDKATSNDSISIYDVKSINGALFSTAVFPQYSGRYREANSVVLGGGFETTGFQSIPHEMMMLGDELESLLTMAEDCTCSRYIEQVVSLHHKLTVVHPFRDGNGRTLRAFANLLFLRRGLPPVLFNVEAKHEYKNALSEADATKRLDTLYELYFRQMLKSYSILTDNVL